MLTRTNKDPKTHSYPETRVLKRVHVCGQRLVIAVKAFKNFVSDVDVTYVKQSSHEIKISEESFNVTMDTKPRPVAGYTYTFSDNCWRS
jgi:hypothetical protein